MMEGQEIYGREFQSTQRRPEQADLIFGQQREDQDLFAKWQLDTSDVLGKLFYQIQGYVFDQETKKWFVRQHVMNEQGAIEITSYLNSHFSQFFSLSNLTDKEINRICRETRLWIIDSIFLNHNRFQVEKDRADWIVHIIDHTVYVNLKRAREGKQAELLSIQQRIIESISDRGGEGGGEKKKRFNFFNLFNPSKEGG